jgi:hypothetical protein
MGAFAKQAVERHQCVYCGKPISVHLRQCPYCREMIPEVQLSLSRGPDGRLQIRRGLLFMLLAAVIHYVAAGYAAPLQLPVFFMPIVTTYLSALLFLGGLGLTIFGFYLRVKS